MPRISSESRAAAAFRAGISPPRPPKCLGDEPKKIWRSIVAEWPADKFTSGSQEILADFCTFSAQANELRRHIGVTEDFVQALVFQDQLQKLARLKAALATKLRLAPSSAVRADAGENTEARPAVTSRLLGGKAGWKPKVVKSG